MTGSLQTRAGLTALVFLRTVAAFAGLEAGLEAGLALPPVLRSARAQLALSPVARVLLPPAARELVGVQDVQHGEGGGPVPGGALGTAQSNYSLSVFITVLTGL